MELVVDITTRFPAAYLGALVLNTVLYSTLLLLIWRLFASALATRKIQPDRALTRTQLWRETRNALIVMCVGVGTSCIIIVLGERGLTKVYMDIDDHAFSWAYLTFPLLLVINDTVFYWVHRLLHTRRLYRAVHHEHHKSVTVNPLTALSFHIVEPMLLTLWIIPIALIMPIYAPMLGLLQLYGLYDNVKAHLGYELYPHWFNRSPLRFLTTSTYHDLHHSRFRGNYGLHFRFWDQLMGTENPEYEATFLKTTAPVQPATAAE